MWRPLAALLASVLFGVGFARYAQLVDGSGPVLDVVSAFGLWGLAVALVLLAAIPTALGFTVAYSYAIPFGTVFGAVSVIGIAYVGTPPSQLEKFGYALAIGLSSALIFGTVAVGCGRLLNRIASRSTRAGRIQR